MKHLFSFNLVLISVLSYAQVDTTFIFNTNRPYGTLDIRIAKSSTRFYYLQENRTVSYRESSPGVKTNTFRDMTSWDSSPYREGNLRERNGSADYFIMNYRLLFPGGYQSGYSGGYPMIVMMHGAGERGNCWDNDCHWADRSWNPNSNNPPAPTSSSHQLLNNDHNMSHGGKQHLDARNLAGTRLPNDPSLSARAFPGFVLFGQNLNGWDTNNTQDLIRLVRLVVKKYNVDPNRIYIHGLSNGGIATYNALKRAPWLFAAALPMSSPNEASILNNGLLPEVAHIPLWIFQGGRDSEPTPQRTEGYVRRFREGGADVRYSLYPNLGHGTWNTAYAEPDFFSWIRSKSKTRIHVFYNNTIICGSSGEGVRLGLARGFLAYQWQRDGHDIPGATGHEYVATQPGDYRARFSRQSRSPGAGQWEEWSQIVRVTGNAGGKPQIIPLTTTHLRGPDNAGPNTIQLRSAAKSDIYYWYKNGARINIPNNSEDDTVRVFTITSTYTGDNGAYTLKTASLDGCQSATSDPVNLFFDNSAPLSDGNGPSSFRLVSVTGSTATLAWNDQSSVESAYEIWRRAPGQSFVLAGRTAPNAESFTDAGLIPSTRYDYKVRMVNNQGRSRYAPDDGTGVNLVVTTSSDSEAPTAPGNLRVVNNSTSSISLAWTASTDNNGSIKHYVVYYDGQSKVTNSSTPSYTLTGLPINRSFNITVKAVDNAGLFSPSSNQVTGTTSVSGLWYGHSTGAWKDLDQITIWNQPEFTGHVPNFTLAPRTQENFFNFEFKGYLYINTGGSYYFYLNSDDGSRIYIDGKQVLDFDGLHGKSTANDGFGMRSAAISLGAGAHDIRVIFFQDISGHYLSVAYQGADTDNAKQYIPNAALTSGNPAGSENNAPVVNFTSPENDQQFAAPASISLQATASDNDGDVTKVEFFNGTTKLAEDAIAPYTFTWSNVSGGAYTLIAKATDNEGASNTSSVDIFVTSGQACAGAGIIGHEVWTNIEGVQISSIPVNEEPSSTQNLTIFEGPSNIGDNYGRRIRGYICPPLSGTYTFWVSSNDNSELWLSTDGNPANKRKIAFVTGYTNVREWGKYSSQQSASVTLVASQRYYIEALQKEGVGTDHLAVGWQLPGGGLERPIPGMRLIPFQQSGNSSSPVATITSPEDGQMYTAPANVVISANASIADGDIVKVEFYNGSTKLGEDLTSPYSYSWNNVSAGSYTLVAKAIDSNGASGTSAVEVFVASGQACAGGGRIGHEVWTGIEGVQISSIPVNEEPSSVMDLTVFEGPSNIGDNYGRRIRGYVCVPLSGNYTFWVSSNDNSELWLSTDENPANKRRIAFVSGYTNVRQWDKYGSQRSAPVTLVASQRYYIEALQKEGVGTDHLAVGWQLPDGSFERPIPGMRLIPFDSSGDQQDTGGDSAPVVSITSPENGQYYSAPALVNISADASVADGNISKVEFYNGTVKLGEDGTAPYSYSWTDVGPGNYSLVAKALTDDGTSSIATVSVTVTGGGSSACTGTGTVLRELWTGIEYNDVASIPLNTAPDFTSQVTMFEDPSNYGDHYGTRVSGYLCVPATGSYTFWISSNDHSELWLSTDENPSNRRKIAYVTGYTNPREWTKFSSQQSSSIQLIAGQRYYIEALHKEGVGTDHMAVGWQLPDGTFERPIPGNRLSPYGTQPASPEMMATTFMDIDAENVMSSNADGGNTQVVNRDIEIFPNPLRSGTSDLTISGYAGSNQSTSATVEIMRMTGEVVYRETISCETNCQGKPINIRKELDAGVYLIKLDSNGKRHLKRLLVK